MFRLLTHCIEDIHYTVRQRHGSAEVRLVNSKSHGGRVTSNRRVGSLVLKLEKEVVAKIRGRME